MKLRGGQIIILLNFLVKITNIAYFWPFKEGIVPPIPPSGRNTGLTESFQRCVSTVNDNTLRPFFIFAIWSIFSAPGKMPGDTKQKVTKRAYLSPEIINSSQFVLFHCQKNWGIRLALLQWSSMLPIVNSELTSTPKWIKICSQFWRRPTPTLTSLQCGTVSRRRNVWSGGMHRSMLAAGFRSADTFY
jgi:hypothetical protein